MLQILIVDNSVITRRNLKLILNEAGHQVVAQAVNGTEAYNKYAECLPDIVIIGINTPLIDVMSPIKSIIKDFPNANIVIAGTPNQRNTVFEALEYGAKNYIIKPITLEKITNALEAVI